MTASVVPLVIPKGVELFDVDGIPVTLGDMPGSLFPATAWDTPSPRKFDPDLARHNGVSVSEEEFRDVVARATRGSTMSWYDWMEARHTCPKCAWAGLGRVTKIGDTFNDGSERHCPECDHYFGFVAYPLITESLTDPRAPRGDRLFAEVVMQAVAEIKAEQAIARAALTRPAK
jgi:hypothetical protein